ncbi:methyltransferase (TIGR00027 family) [Arthrobacter globiformis]|uniref:SAM-dependent methyltransferase n=1 Tax=Arthrobacter globiformis TaxID=1665 RepID=UPI002784DA91|nr:SAM-dependent methyltransferase [Arthrobacter globiformis]MDQ1057309.1 methyltransferase (TIGR00027 family) [Arthrobacter globiformis]
MTEPTGSTELEGGAKFKDQGLPMTALAVAAGRAVETSRADPLVADPFASALVVAARSHLDLPTVWPAEPAEAPPLQQPLLLASIYIGMRTRFIDDFLRSDPRTAQTVVLGAGLDTRAFRLQWPEGAKVIEIDSANVLEFKAHVLSRLSAKPVCELITLAADLSLPWREPLLAAGFDPAQPTTWVLEGLLPYLDAATQRVVLEEVAALSAPGSRAVIERAVALPKTDDIEAKLLEFSQQTGLPMSELLARADPPDPVELLESAGWRCGGHTVEELCSRYGRVLSLAPADQSEPAASGPEQQPTPDQSRGGFVTAWLP